jgi:hypothetical protein
MTDTKSISDEILNFLQKSKIRKETCNDVVTHLKTVFPDEFFTNRYNTAIKELIRDEKITTINCILCLITPR